MLRIKIKLILITVIILGAAFIVYGGKNLLVNGDFEKGGADQGLPPGWDLESASSGAIVAVTDKKTRSGKYALMIKADEANDIRLSQTISVKPSRYYRLAGWIAVENVPADNVGGNLCVVAGFDHSVPVHGTRDWSYVKFDFRTHDKQRRVTVAARLGMFCSTNTGTAYFDDLTLTEMAKPEGEFIQLDNPEAGQQESSAWTGFRINLNPGKFLGTILIGLFIIAQIFIIHKGRKSEIEKR